MKLMIAGSRSITDFDISPYIRPDYARYKRGAPIKRNERMVDYADKVIVFWDNVSRGTKHTIDYAQKTGKPIEVIIVSA